MADRAAVKTEIKKLVRAGQKLLRREIIAKAQADQRDKFIEQLGDDPDREEMLRAPRFVREYQAWYSPALRLVEQLLPDRYTEFHNLYRDERRKKLDAETFGIADYLTGLIPAAGFAKDTSLIRAMGAFERQIAIVDTAEARLDSVLTDIGRTLHSEILDDELDAARDLLSSSQIRAAGVLAGVALEAHLKKLISDHHVTFRKKAMLSNLNDALKEAGVYDATQWRHIQYLTDIRNLCGHKAERDPERTQVETLINEVAKITKNLF